MNIDSVHVDHLYRTRSGAICKVTAIADDEDRTVSFVRYGSDKGETSDALPAMFFAANAEEEVESVDPQGRPMPESSAATPV